MARDYGIGRLIGNPTAGTAGEISSFSLGNDYGFSWTTIKAVDKSGKEIYGQGIKPTVVNNMVTDKDETLLLGFEILNY
jgi:C-terminal processing protease CtpA/Prc